MPDGGQEESTLGNTCTSSGNCKCWDAIAGQGRLFGTKEAPSIQNSLQAVNCKAQGMAPTEQGAIFRFRGHGKCSISIVPRHVVQTAARSTLTSSQRVQLDAVSYLHAAFEGVMEGRNIVTPQVNSLVNISLFTMWHS